MTSTMQRPASTSAVADMEQATRELPHLDPSLLTHIEQNSEPTGRAAERRHRAKQLTALADGDRSFLEELRAGLLRRLHRTVSDSDATEGLRTVELALSMTPRPAELRTWPRRERDPPRRWWHRRRGVQTR